MGNVSRPLIGLLVATVALFAVWTIALKPSNSSTSSSSGSAYRSAITKAHQAVAISDAANAASGRVVASGWAGSPSTPATAPTTARTPLARAIHIAPASRHRLDAVSRALARHKVLALLFYNPAAADDRAVKQELTAVQAAHGAVFKLAVPLSELTRYTVVTSRVPVDVSPTLVLIDRHRQATTIVGFADRFEIQQRVLDAVG